MPSATPLPSYLAFAINLDRRPDRLEAMRKLPLVFERLAAIDGRTLSWDADAPGVVQPQALRDAQWAAQRSVPTICRRTGSFSPHLTLSALGCALSHRAAWRRLADQREHSWALILEDDVSGVAERFEAQLRALLAQLPPTWRVCFLGYHESRGVLLTPRAAPRALELPAQAALTGLYGYVLTRAAAAELLRSVFPLRCQVDVAMSAIAWPAASRFACAPDAVLLTAAKSEEGACDTDIQTLGKPSEHAHTQLPRQMLRL